MKILEVKAYGDFDMQYTHALIEIGEETNVNDLLHEFNAKQKINGTVCNDYGITSIPSKKFPSAHL